MLIDLFSPLSSYQEGKEQALYYEAHVLDVQRRRHDVRGCRCRFLVLYDHDQFEVLSFGILSISSLLFDVSLNMRLKWGTDIYMFSPFIKDRIMHNILVFALIRHSIVVTFSQVDRDMQKYYYLFHFLL